MQSELWITLKESPDINAVKTMNSIANKIEMEALVSSKINSNMLVVGRHTNTLLDSLESIESSVISMLLIGIPEGKLCQYKEINHIQYAQLISSIVRSKAWEIYLEKETSIRRKSRIRAKLCKGG
jgi:hypothetical protein